MADRSAAALLRQHFGVSVDHCEQIIEIMGDAARKTAYALQPLGLPELFFQVDPLRDIGGQDKTSRAFSEHEGMCGDFDIDDLAVLLAVAPRPRLVEFVGWSRRVLQEAWEYLSGRMSLRVIRRNSSRV